MSFININLNNKDEIQAFELSIQVSSEAQDFLRRIKGRPSKYLLEKEFWEKLSELNDSELECALFQWVDKKFFTMIESDNVVNQKVLCRCVSYLEKDFINFLKENPSIEESEIASEIQVGAGCGSCLMDVHCIYDKVNLLKMTPFYVGIKAQSLIDERKIKGLKVVKTQDKKIYLKKTLDVCEKNNFEVIQKKFKDFEFVIIREE